MDIREQYKEASLKTADNLRTIAHSIAGLSHLTLPEIDSAVELVSEMLPAGNVPGMVLDGLARLPRRTPPSSTVRHDIDLLLRGMGQVLDRAIYGAFFAGPAAVIWGYQALLRLAAKDADAAFPDGTWQFYLEYALREDTARHATETHGFDTTLRHHHLELSPYDRVTAWTMAAIHLLHQYDALLANEWRERTYCQRLSDVTQHEPEARYFAGLYKVWEKQRPYMRGADAGPKETYAQYRHRRFDEYLGEPLSKLNREAYQQWRERIRAAEQHELPAYQHQMSILAHLKPGPYGEARIPIERQNAMVGVIHKQGYHLIPIWLSESQHPPDVATVRSYVADLMARDVGFEASRLAPLAQVRRAALSGLCERFDPKTQQEFDLLCRAPILINSDLRPPHLCLSQIRQTERGIGDHALTIFDTGHTFVFDQSHIFFDGAWGAALAEILTNEALSWAVYLSRLPPISPGKHHSRTLTFRFSTADRERLRQAPHVMAEASAETDIADMKAILSLRRSLRQRNQKIRLTVNDLLVLYRAIHAVSYHLPDQLKSTLKNLPLAPEHQNATQEILHLFEKSRMTNPTMLIPVDASQRSPRDRLYPMAFEVPLVDLDLLQLHERTLQSLDDLNRAKSERQVAYSRFDALRRTYLATLAGFGAMINRAKEIALMGESASVGSIRLLAYMPPAVQRLLDKVPEQFDLLNDLIKGREVFSNVGAVAPTSTLTRFISAKDDNEKKTLVWGVITDARGVMHISLRDFRPYVGLLNRLGHQELATRIAQDYLHSYTRGLNEYIYSLQQIASARRD